MATATVTKQRVGKIVQIIGPVVDVEFEAGHLPEISPLRSGEAQGARGDDLIARSSSTSAIIASAVRKPTDGCSAADSVDLGDPISGPSFRETLGAC